MPAITCPFVRVRASDSTFAPGRNTNYSHFRWKTHVCGFLSFFRTLTNPDHALDAARAWDNNEDSALSGSSSAVERKLPKLDVAGSIPVSRSNITKHPIETGLEKKPRLPPVRVNRQADWPWCAPSRAPAGCLHGNDRPPANSLGIHWLLATAIHRE